MQLDKQLCFKIFPGMFDTTKFDVFGDPRKTISLKGVSRCGDMCVCGDGEKLEFFVVDGFEGKAYLKTKSGQYMVAYNQKVCLKSDGSKLEVARAGDTLDLLDQYGRKPGGGDGPEQLSN